MNKYERFSNMYEIPEIISQKIKIHNIAMSIRNYLRDDKIIPKEADDKALIVTILLLYSRVKYSAQQWIKENVINQFNNQSIRMAFISTLINEISSKETSSKDLPRIQENIESFNQTGVVDSCKLKKDDEKYCLEINDKIIIKYGIAYEEAQKYEGLCHICTQYMVQNLMSTRIKSQVVTCLVDGSAGDKFVHSVIVLEDGTMFDMVMNFKMDFNDYKELFQPIILSQVEDEKFVNLIEHLKIKDKEYNESGYYDVLKIANYNVGPHI